MTNKSGTDFAAPANPVLDTTNWRRKVNEAKIKFDDTAKARFLNEFRNSGSVGAACAAGGISHGTYRSHLKLDPDFAEAYTEAYEARRAYVVTLLEQQALDGHEEVIETEKSTRTRKVYESGIRLAMLKKYDPDGYREKNSLDVNMKGGGGVLVIPMMLTEEQWMAVYAPRSQPETVESEADEARRTAEDVEIFE